MLNFSEYYPQNCLEVLKKDTATGSEKKIISACECLVSKI